MVMNNEYASKGVAGAGLGTGNVCLLGKGMDQG